MFISRVNEVSNKLFLKQKSENYADMHRDIKSELHLYTI